MGETVRKWLNELLIFRELINIAINESKVNHCMACILMNSVSWKLNNITYNGTINIVCCVGSIEIQIEI